MSYNTMTIVLHVLVLVFALRMHAIEASRTLLADRGYNGVGFDYFMFVRSV